MTKLINLNKEKIKNINFTRPGDYVVFFHNLSGDFTFEIKSENANVDIYGIFIGKESDDFTVHTTQSHKSPSSISNLLIKGVFYDRSKFHYQGLIRIDKNAQKSHAYQKNQNLMLSSECFIQSKPYLEILANDVFCTHGSTTGGLNKEQLLYTLSRGISERKAEELLVRGFIGDIITKINTKIPDFNYNLHDHSNQN